MADKVGSIYYDLTLDKSKFDSAADGVVDKLGTLSKRIAQFVSASTIAFATFGLKTAGDLESARQGFVTLLGSAEKADDVIAQIKKDAAQTPFELKGLIEANQALTAVTKNGQRSEAILLDVGKALAASGKGQAELDRMIANLQQIGLTGKITAMDIKQFGMAGVNILEILADYYGTTKDKAVDMVQNSKDAFGDLEKALAKAGGAGGKFENAFKNQSGTFNQSLSNMKDSITIFASDFVKQIGLFDWAKSSMVKFTDSLTNNKQSIYDFVNTLKELSARIFEVATQVWSYLQPKLEALWNSISTELIPVLYDFWHTYLEPLVPVLGVALVGAIGLVVDAANMFIVAFTAITNWINNNQAVFLLLIGLFTTLAIKMNFGSIVAAFNGAMASARAMMVATQGTLGALNGALTGFTGFAVIGLAAAAATVQVYKMFSALNDVKRLAEEVNRQQSSMGAGTTAFYQSLKNALAEGRISQAEYSRRLKEYNANFQTFTGRAVGGPVNANQPYIVGEKGPEMFVPKNSGTIIPNDKMAGSAVSIYGNVTIGSQADADSFFARLTRNQELAQLGITTRIGAMG